MSNELYVQRLQPEVSALVDEVVTRFAEENRLQLHRLRHDADLWMVFQPAALPERAGSAEYRLTVTSYAEAPAFLSFVPDLLVFEGGSRLVLEPALRESLTHHIALRDLEVARTMYKSRLLGEAMLEHPVEQPQEVKRIAQELFETCERAWTSAIQLGFNRATVLLP